MLSSTPAREVHSSVKCNTSSGFTLIELLIAVAIAGIIMAIAVPAYTSFVDKSKMRAAQGDLASLSVFIENDYQRQLSYPDIAAGDDVGTRYPNWNPTSPATTYIFSAVSTATPGAYTLTATGQGNFAGCIITLTNENVRATTNCTYGDGDWI